MKSTRYLVAMAVVACVTFVPQPTAAQATFQELHRFSAPFLAGDVPLVAATDGKLYGVLPTGGLRDGGMVFSLTPGAGTTFTFAVVHEFLGPEGLGPRGLIQASDGHFYGTTDRVFGYSGGSIFKMDSAGNVTTLLAFDVSQVRGLVDGARRKALRNDRPRVSVFGICVRHRQERGQFRGAPSVQRQ